MTTTVAPNLNPDHTESDTRPTLVPVPADTTPQERDVRWFDPTQGRKLGSDPYDDPTQGRRIGADLHDDPTRGRWHSRDR